MTSEDNQPARVGTMKRKSSSVLTSDVGQDSPSASGDGHTPSACEQTTVRPATARRLCTGCCSEGMRTGCRVGVRKQYPCAPVASRSASMERGGASIVARTLPRASQIACSLEIDRARWQISLSRSRHVYSSV